MSLIRFLIFLCALFGTQQNIYATWPFSSQAIECSICHKDLKSSDQINKKYFNCDHKQFHKGCVHLNSMNGSITECPTCQAPFSTNILKEYPDLATAKERKEEANKSNQEMLLVLRKKQEQNAQEARERDPLYRIEKRLERVEEKLDKITKTLIPRVNNLQGSLSTLKESLETISGKVQEFEESLKLLKGALNH